MRVFQEKRDRVLNDIRSGYSFYETALRNDLSPSTVMKIYTNSVHGQLRQWQKEFSQEWEKITRKLLEAYGEKKN